MAAKNFGIAVVTSAPSPATSGTSFGIAVGEQTRFTTGLPVTIGPATGNWTPANSEVGLLTATGSGTLTITRAIESSSARTVVVGDIILQGISAGMWEAPSIAGPITLGEGGNIVVGTSTGTKIGTATSQKIAFFNSTPIVQPISTTDLRTLLINLGLLASGGASPLNLNGGTLTAANIVGTTDIDVVAPWITLSGGNVPTLTQGVSIACTVDRARYRLFGKLAIVQIQLSPTASGTNNNDVVVTVPAVIQAASTGSFSLAGTMQVYRGAMYIGGAVFTSASQIIGYRDGAAALPIGRDPVLQIVSGDKVSLALAFETV